MNKNSIGFRKGWFPAIVTVQIGIIILLLLNLHFLNYFHQMILGYWDDNKSAFQHFKENNDNLIQSNQKEAQKKYVDGFIDLTQKINQDYLEGETSFYTGLKDSFYGIIALNILNVVVIFCIKRKSSFSANSISPPSQ